MKCGCCGGGLVKISQTHFGCATAPNKGTCDNLTTIGREALEATVLDGLQNRLMEPALCDLFAEEYARHMNRLLMEHNAAIEGHRAELAAIDREADRLVQAIADGVPAARVKDRMIELEARETELKDKLAHADEMTVLLHPRMGQHYRRQIARLRDALNSESRRAEAVEIVRGLVERIELHPVEEDGRRSLAVDLIGELAGILSLAQETKKPAPVSGDGLSQVKMVAGACNHLNLLFGATG